MGCHFLLQGIFPIQGLNPSLLQFLQVDCLPQRSLAGHSPWGRKELNTERLTHRTIQLCILLLTHHEYLPFQSPKAMSILITRNILHHNLEGEKCSPFIEELSHNSHLCPLCFLVLRQFDFVPTSPGYSVSRQLERRWRVNDLSPLLTWDDFSLIQTP